MARRKELTAAQARKVIAEMVAISSGETMSFHSIESWLTDWLANKAGGAAEGTMLRYRQVVRDFLAHLGPATGHRRHSRRYRPGTSSRFGTGFAKRVGRHPHATQSSRRC